MICDVHAHYTPKKFSEFMGDRFASPVHLPVKRGMARHPFSNFPEDIEGRFELMDAAGVEKQVLVAEPSALPARRGGMRPSGADAERRLRRPGAPLPEAHRLIRDAAIAAYRRRAEGDGARLRPVGLRRRQHEHHLPRPLDRRDRVRADLRRDEPARRGPLRASRQEPASARRSSSTTISARRSAPRWRTRPLCCT